MISNFSELVLSLHIYLNNISKIWFLQEKKSFLRKISNLKTGKNPGKILAWGEITISPRVTSAHDDFTEKNRFCTYINSNRNRFSEWPLMSGIEISSSRGL